MRSRLTLIFLLVLFIAVAGSPWPRAQNPKPAKPNAAGKAAEPQASPLRKPDVIYVPTPPEVVEEMLRMADVHKGDVVYDLGSGDGRIVIAAAQKYGVRGVGIEIDAARVKEAEENASRAGVEKLVKFRNEDLFEADISEATVVTLYLLESLNLKLKPKLLRDLKPGTRIVSQTFGMGDWQPEKTSELEGRSVYLWRVPEKPAAPKSAARLSDSL